MTAKNAIAPKGAKLSRATCGVIGIALSWAGERAADKVLRGLANTRQFATYEPAQKFMAWAIDAAQRLLEFATVWAGKQGNDHSAA